MKKVDPLSGETSVSAQVTPTGINAKAKSRFVSAVDRLAGNIVDLPNLALERWAERARARTEAERKIVEAAGAAAAKRIESDPAFADRAIDAHLSRIMRRQSNIDGVVAAALEDLQSSPPVEADDGPAHLGEDFVERLEFYAGGATSDQLRERWGRVFAAEVRKPGTFSVKSLRLVDEIDPNTANLFERLCASRLGKCIPTRLSGGFHFPEEAALSDAGLIVTVGLGQIWNGAKVNDGGGQQFWLWSGERAAFGLPATATPGPPRDGLLFSEQNNGVAMAIYALTDAGNAIAGIIDTDEIATCYRLRTEAHQQGLQGGRVYVRQANGDFNLAP